METSKQKIAPCLWFNRQAEEAVDFYLSVFENSRINERTYATKAAEAVSGLPAGELQTIGFELEGMTFVALNGGPEFVFTPAISFIVACQAMEEVDRIWGKLEENGQTLMELGKTSFSERYGWTQDRYGISWQVMYAGDPQITQKITPQLLFAGPRWGKAEEAMRFYTTVFKKADTGDIYRYPAGAEPDKEGTIQYASLTIEGMQFAVMDSGVDHHFNFNEAISLIVHCQGQEEIDHYWGKLTAEGGQESVCGWLRDKYGISWQIVPAFLDEMLQDKDRQKVERVTEAFLKMKKLDIEELRKAFGGEREAAAVRKRPGKTRR